MLRFRGLLQSRLLPGFRPRRLEIVWDDGRLIAADPEDQFFVDMLRREIEAELDGVGVGIVSGQVWTAGHFSEALPTILVMERFVYVEDEVVVTGTSLPADEDEFGDLDVQE